MNQTQTRCMLPKFRFMKKSIITFAFLLSFFIRAYCQIDSSAFIKGFACIFSLSTPENWIRDEVQNQDGIEVAFLPDTSALKNGHTFIYANSGTSDIDSVIKWDQNDFKIKHPKADYQRQQPILTHKGDSAIIFQILIKNEMYFEKNRLLKSPDRNYHYCSAF